MEYFTELLPILIPGVVLFAAWLILRNKATPITSGNEIDTMVGNGTPVVMKFFRNT